MKSIVGMTALTALLVGTSLTAVQAAEVKAVGFHQGPQLLLAEGGGERLMFNQQRIQAQASKPEASDEGERFAQLMKEQPTAAGNSVEQQLESKPEPSFRSPILQDRELYGSPH